MTEMQMHKETREYIKAMIKYKDDEESASRDVSHANARYNQAVENIERMRVLIIGRLGVKDLDEVAFNYNNQTYKFSVCHGCVRLEKINVILDF